MMTPDDFDGPSDLDEYLEFACDDAVFSELLSRGKFGCCFVLKSLKADDPTSFQLNAKFKLPPEIIAARNGDKMLALSDFVAIIKGLVDEDVS